MNMTITGNDNDYQIKFQDNNVELNIKSLSIEDIISLSNVATTNWDTRNVIKVGNSASSSVFWASDNEHKTVSVLVGYDDETLDFGITCNYDYFLEEINMFIYGKPKLF